MIRGAATIVAIVAGIALVACSSAPKEPKFQTCPVLVQRTPSPPPDGGAD